MSTPSIFETDIESSLTGLLIGQAVGDALGLPWEGLTRRRATRMFGSPDRYRFLLGRGMISDDTEHACMTAQAVLAFPDDADRFARSLGWKLRWWMAGLPAGIGFATLRAICKLWMGVSPLYSGVFSAGNGPAMRAPVLGACFRQDREALRRYIRVSTRLTHVDPKAEEGAFAVALSVAWIFTQHTGIEDYESLPDLLIREATDPEFINLLKLVRESLSGDLSVEVFSDSIGLEEGVSGYIYHTVPVAVYAFLRHLGDYETTVKSVIALGGDTDSTAAVAGALAGAAAGYEGVPAHLVEDLREWPRSVSWIKRLAHRLVMAENDSTLSGQVPLFWPGVILRNILFLATVLIHGLRRLLPPY